MLLPQKTKKPLLSFLSVAKNPLKALAEAALKDDAAVMGTFVA